MNDAKVRRWAGTFGVAGFVVFLAALPLYYLAGPEPRIEDTAATSAFVTRASTFILTRATLADPLIMIGFLVFLAGFRHTIRLARPDHEWVSTLVFGAGLVVITLELVGDALQAAAVLDTVVKAEPAVVRAQALHEGDSVTTYARHPEKLAIVNDRLTVVEGELSDAAAIERAVEGADITCEVRAGSGLLHLNSSQIDVQDESSLFGVALRALGRRPGDGDGVLRPRSARTCASV